MPFRSEAQRRLFYSAASKKSGAGGVKQADAKEMVKDDTGGKLPDRADRKDKRRKAMYDKKD